MTARKNSRDQRPTQPRHPQLAGPLRIELTNEEILADLRYPARIASSGWRRA